MVNVNLGVSAQKDRVFVLRFRKFLRNASVTRYLLPVTCSIRTHGLGRLAPVDASKRRTEREGILNVSALLWGTMHGYTCIGYRHENLFHRNSRIIYRHAHCEFRLCLDFVFNYRIEFDGRFLWKWFDTCVFVEIDKNHLWFSMSLGSTSTNNSSMKIESDNYFSGQSKCRTFWIQKSYNLFYCSSVA